MADIPAALVKKLRDETGAPMMDCKRALVETDADYDAALRLIRERGQAQALKRADRSTSEGLVGYRLAEDGSKAAMVAVGCETEPVSKNEEFQTFAKKVLDIVDEKGAGAETELEDERIALVAKLGENIVIVGSAHYEATNGEFIAGYAHPPANKLGVLVQMKGGDADLGRKVAMHIAASAPMWIGRDTVPEEKLEEWRSIFQNSDEVLSKPEQAREKIVEGMLNKRFFGANVLLDQEWVHDSSKSVAQALKEAGAEVLDFERFSVAG
jgi:elongation factor Ts